MEDDQKVGTMKRPLTLRHLIKIVALVLLVFGTYWRCNGWTSERS